MLLNQLVEDNNEKVITLHATVYLPIIIIIIGERAKRARHYRGNTIENRGCLFVYIYMFGCTYVILYFDPLVFSC